MTGKNNLLMVCPVFPPQITIGGLRAAMFSKYLVYFGWNPVILTRVFPKNDERYQIGLNINGIPAGDRIIPVYWGAEDEHNTIRKRGILKKTRDFFKPDYTQPHGLINAMLNVAEREIVNNSVDVIWATAPDQSCLTVASILSKKFDAPWIADYRDIPEQHKIDGFRNRLLLLRVKYRRKQTARTAAAVVTISKHHAAILGRDFNRKVEVIYNGFDPENFKPAESCRSDKFIISYMGRIINKSVSNPEIFFKSLDLMSQCGGVDLEDFSINFYGTEKFILKDILKKYQCKRIVNILDRLAYENVPAVLQKSTINLILTEKGRKGVLTTKLFEYIAVKRPILCVPEGSSELTEIITDTNAGIVCNSVEHTVQTLKEWYLEWKKSGTVKCHIDETKKNQYSRKLQAGQLSDLLFQVIRGQYR